MGHVRAGIDKALDEFGTLDSFSIDTWGCDYVLLKGDQEVWPCHAYRDNRTETVIPAVHEKVPFAELYAHTGCQFQPFNTVYQLCDDLGRGRLEGVTDFLMAPEYLLWKLTGVKLSKARYDQESGAVTVEMTGEVEGDLREVFRIRGSEGDVVIAEAVEGEKWQKNLVIWREFAIIEVSESTSGGITGENIRGIWLISKKMSDVRA